MAATGGWSGSRSAPEQPPAPAPDAARPPDLGRARGEGIREEFLTAQLLSALQALETPAAAEPAAPADTKATPPRPELKVEPVPWQVGAQMTADYLDRTVSRARAALEQTHS